MEIIGLTRQVSKPYGLGDRVLITRYYLVDVGYEFKSLWDVYLENHSKYKKIEKRCIKIHGCCVGSDDRCADECQPYQSKSEQAYRKFSLAIERLTEKQCKRGEKIDFRQFKDNIFVLLHETRF